MSFLEVETLLKLLPAPVNYRLTDEMYKHTGIANLIVLEIHK